MKDQGGGGVSVARKIVSPKKPQPARQVLAQQSAASRVTAQKKMLQTMVRQSTPPGAPGVGGGSKPMYSMVPRPNAGPGDNFLKWLVEQGTKVINGVGDAVTGLSNKVPEISHEVSAPAFGNWWSRTGQSAANPMIKAQNFFSRYIK